MVFRIVIYLFIFGNLTKGFAQDSLFRSFSFEVGFRKASTRVIVDEDYRFGLPGPTGISNFSVGGYGDSYGGLSIPLLKQQEYFFESTYKINRFQFPFYCSVISSSIQGIASYGVYGHYKPSLYGILQNYSTVNASYNSNSVFFNLKFGIGFNLISPKKDFQIVPFIKIGAESMISNTVTENSVRHRRVYQTNAMPPDVSQNFDSTFVTHDADEMILFNRRVKDLFSTFGVKFGFLFYKKIGVNLECGVQLKGNALINYGNTYLFRSGFYYQTGIVYQFNLPAKKKKTFS
jgi:hypothetical protein